VKLYISCQFSVQGYYQAGPRPQQPRGISHRGGQGASGTPVVGMAGVGGGGGQPPTIYPHPAGLSVQTSAMYIGQSQVHGLHTGPHQQSVYPINNQMPIHQVLIASIILIFIFLCLIIYMALFTFTNILFLVYSNKNVIYFLFVVSFLVHLKGINRIKIRRFIKRFNLQSCRQMCSDMLTRPLLSMAVSFPTTHISHQIHTIRIMLNRHIF